MGSRAVVTVRMPAEMVQEAKELKREQESLNDLIVEAIEKELRRRRTLNTLESIEKTKAAIRERSGVHPDSVPLIRALREGNERDD